MTFSSFTNSFLGNKRAVATLAAVVFTAGGFQATQAFAASTYEDPFGRSVNGQAFKVDIKSQATVFQDRGTIGANALVKTDAPASYVDEGSKSEVFCTSADGNWYWTEGKLDAPNSPSNWGWVAKADVLDTSIEVPNCHFSKELSSGSALATLGGGLGAPTTTVPPPPPPPPAPVYPQGACGNVINGWSKPVAGAYRNGGGFGAPHYSLDLMASSGTPICSITAGTVARVASNSTNGCGNWVIIHHPSINLYSMSCHGVDKPSVKPGQSVAAGQLIMRVGKTGNAPGGNHLHLEIATNSNINIASRSSSTRRDPQKLFRDIGQPLF